MAAQSASSQRYYCSLASREAGEQLFGSATRTDVWLALEYRGAWHSKAFEQSALPQAVKDHLSAQAAALPNARIQLIRRQGETPDFAFYVAVAREADPLLYAFRLHTYEDLLALDIAAIATGEAAYVPYLSNERLFLVCTNGERDACCGRFGAATFAALAQIDEGTAWRTIHVGGHRFAPNVVVLPHGIFYGRVAAEDVQRVVDDYRQGRLTLDRLRGRACYPPEAQVAEYFLRTETGIDALEAFRLLEVQPDGAERWRVRFEERDTGRTHLLEIAAEAAEPSIRKSCGDAVAEPITRYRLLRYLTPAP